MFQKSSGLFAGVMQRKNWKYSQNSIQQIVSAFHDWIWWVPAIPLSRREIVSLNQRRGSRKTAAAKKMKHYTLDCWQWRFAVQFGLVQLAVGFGADETWKSRLPAGNLFGETLCSWFWNGKLLFKLCWWWKKNIEIADQELQTHGIIIRVQNCDYKKHMCFSFFLICCEVSCKPNSGRKLWMWKNVRSAWEAINIHAVKHVRFRTASHSVSFDLAKILTAAFFILYSKFQSGIYN